MRRLIALWSGFASLGLSSCFGFVHDEVLDEPYHLVAVEVMEQMRICRRWGDTCNGDELGGETVFMAGWNKNYVVGARHPRNGHKPINRAITEYFYIVRLPEERSGRPMFRGPFDARQYDVEKRRLNLPEFTRIFHSLK
jgi:hypothetical protein